MFAFMSAAAAVAVAQTPPPSEARIESKTGTIVEIAAFESKVLKNTRGLHIYLPPDYEANKRRRYPVLYVHDGQNVFNGATSYLPNKEWRLDETAQALIQAKLIEPIIIVGIDNAGADRANEYLPTNVKFQDNPPFGGRADQYARMIIEEIKPMVDKTYRTKPDAKNTGLMGSSFGGVATFYLGIAHPDVFTKLGVVSPSVWVDNRVLVKKAQALKEKLPLKIWLDIGTHEGDDPADAAGAVADASALRDALVAKGWTLGKDLVYYEEGFAVHNEDAWARRSPAILMYLFGVRR